VNRLPTLPGEYLWTEWNKVVDVYQTRAGNLALRAPNGQTLRVGPRLAGRFIPLNTAEVGTIAIDHKHDYFLTLPEFLRSPPHVPARRA
jgi:hypothetical protein